MPNNQWSSRVLVKSHPVIIVNDSLSIKVDSKGRIILPSSLRKSMGIFPGETLQLSFDLDNSETLIIQRKPLKGGMKNE